MWVGGACCNTPAGFLGGPLGTDASTSIMSEKSNNKSNESEKTRTTRLGVSVWTTTDEQWRRR